MKNSESKLFKLGEKMAIKYSLGAKKPVYYGVFLDGISRDQLLNWWVATTGTELLADKFAHHMTVKFKPSPEEVEQFAPMIGQQVKLKVIGFAADDKGQAVLVQSDVPSANANPHITVSCATGTTPVYSNSLLAGGVTSADGPTLTGVFDQFPRSM